jgi:hypothetical protein
MDIAYYFIGLLTVSIFFIGKELYKYYTKYTISAKEVGSNIVKWQTKEIKWL